MKNIKIEIMYDGRNYYGMQKQEDKLTIQGLVESALNSLFKTPINLIYAGRTDAGVSALSMTANFFVETNIAPEKIAFALNQFLPNDIRILNSEEAPLNFHSRFMAKRKTYVYSFYENNIELPLFNNEVIIKRKLNFKKMKKAKKYFCKTHDFSAFTNSECEKLDKTRTIYKIKIKRTKINRINHYKVFVTGNGFLYNMVRIIVGTLILVGEEKIEPKQIKKIILNKDRTKAGKTMPAYALSLLNVEY